MLIYTLECGDCQHVWDRAGSIDDVRAVPCPACEAQQTETKRLRITRDESAIDRRADVPFPAIQRTWHGTERVSLGHQYDPENIAEIKANCPSVNLDAQGHLVSDNDRQHRQQLKELSAWKGRLEEGKTPERTEPAPMSTHEKREVIRDAMRSVGA